MCTPSLGFSKTCNSLVRARLHSDRLSIVADPSSPFNNIDDHHRLLASSMGSYASMPIDIRSHIEARLKRTSEFFCSVVIAFVIQDLGLLLDKYAKKGEKWLNE